MKKIFTLLFCVIAMGLAANASDMPLVDRCINVLLGNEQPTTLMAANLDANHDGEITIDDVAVLVDNELQARTGGINRAPAQDNDIDALVKKVLETKTDDPNIENVKDAVDHNLQGTK